MWCIGLALGQKQNTERMTGISVSLIVVFLNSWVKEVKRKYGNEIWLNWLEPVCCKKQQKKFLTSYWFVE